MAFTRPHGTVRPAVAPRRQLQVVDLGGADDRRLARGRPRAVRAPGQGAERGLRERRHGPHLEAGAQFGQDDPPHPQSGRVGGVDQPADRAHRALQILLGRDDADHALARSSGRPPSGSACGIPTVIGGHSGRGQRDPPSRRRGPPIDPADGNRGVAGRDPGPLPRRGAGNGRDRRSRHDERGRRVIGRCRTPPGGPGPRGSGVVASCLVARTKV